MGDDPMVTIRTSGWEPTLEDILNHSGLTRDDVDHEFGVVPTYPKAHEYTIRVKAGAVSKMRSSPELQVIGDFSNPPIEPFAPPR